MKRLFFILMVALWGAFIALALVSPETLDHIWSWTHGVFLPWMIGLLVWQAGRSPRGWRPSP